MSDMGGFDLDRTVARAWDVFRAHLADHIANMVDGDYLTLTAGGDDDSDGSPYVQFCAFDGDAVRCEVASNEFLADVHQLTPADEQTLVAAKWNRPAPDDENGSRNFYIDLLVAYADQAAAMAVLAIKDVWGLPHPTFLDALAWNADGETVFDVGRPTASDETPEPAELPLAIMPADRDELVALVDQVLTKAFGKQPIKDDDGDIPVRTGTAVCFIRVSADAPVVEIFAPLVKDVTNRTRGAEKLSDLNRKYAFAKFFLNDDYVIAQIKIPGLPFVPKHLEDMFELFAKLVDEIDDDLAKTLGGRLPFADSDSAAVATNESEDPDAEDEEDLPPELQTLLELDAEGEPELDAAAVAHICGNDRDKILAFIRTSSEQEIEWRKHAELASSIGDRAEVAACEHEGQAWAKTVESLRAALRVVVTGG